MKKFLIILFSIAFIIGCSNVDKTGSGGGETDIPTITEDDLDKTSEAANSFISSVKGKTIKENNNKLGIVDDNGNLRMNNGPSSYIYNFIGMYNGYAIYKENTELIKGTGINVVFYNAAKLENNAVSIYYMSASYEIKYGNWVAANVTCNEDNSTCSLNSGADANSFPKMQISDIDFNKVGNTYTLQQ